MVLVAVLVAGDNLSGKRAARIREIAGHLGSPTVLRVAALTDRHEAPRPDIEAQLRGIVRLDIDIREIEGKLKASQNRPEADRLSLMRGLAEARPVMAALVRRFGGLPG